MKENKTEKNKYDSAENKATRLPEPASAGNALDSVELANLHKDTEEVIEAALDLMAAQILEALSSVDWAKWLRRHSAATTDNLKAFMDILAPLSRANLNARKLLADLEAAQKPKFKLPFRADDPDDPFPF